MRGTLNQTSIFFALVAVPAALLLAPAGRAVRKDAAPLAIQANAQTAAEVTAVTGPSWLEQQGLDMDETDMGQMGGAGMPPPSGRSEPDLRGAVGERGFLDSLIRRFYALFGSDREAADQALRATFELTGADLYRLNCRSCHGLQGKGSPPEIKSLLDPVRGASPALIMKRMEERGAPIERAFVEELAADAEASIRERLLEGGEKMPPFRHLEGQEVEALLRHMQRLADAPEGEAGEILVPQSVQRVGEHLAKGTCHVCHNATGPGGGHMAMMRGTIPSLESFPRQKSPADMVEKVRTGRSGMMMMRSRMPAFPYLTESEIVAAYLYLATVPPR